MVHTAWKMSPAVYSDGLTGDTVIKMDYLPPVPLHAMQCPGCYMGTLGHIEYLGEWYCDIHHAEVTDHPDSWMEYGDWYTGPTYMEYED